MSIHTVTQHVKLSSLNSYRGERKAKMINYHPLNKKMVAVSVVAILSLVMVMAPSTRSVFAAETYANSNHKSSSVYAAATTTNNQSKAGATTTTQSANKFVAKLSGKDEVPSVKDTKATGTADFELSSDGKMLKYKVDVMNIDKVTSAYIDSGKVGQNGNVVVTLFKSKTPAGPKNGILSQGDITPAKLEGPLKGKQISDLIKLIKDGRAYVNIDTEKNPKGEIRGQIKV
jgi:hypothetical protein